MGTLELLLNCLKCIQDSFGVHIALDSHNKLWLVGKNMAQEVVELSSHEA